MTSLLNEAVAAVQRMPARDQDEIARSLFRLVRDRASARGGETAADERPSAVGSGLAEDLRLWPRRGRR